jgi:hypothetical protein
MNTLGSFFGKPIGPIQGGKINAVPFSVGLMALYAKISIDFLSISHAFL